MLHYIDQLIWNCVRLLISTVQVVYNRVFKRFLWKQLPIVLENDAMRAQVCNHLGDLIAHRGTIKSPPQGLLTSYECLTANAFIRSLQKHFQAHWQKENCSLNCRHFERDACWIFKSLFKASMSLIWDISAVDFRVSCLIFVHAEH